MKYISIDIETTGLDRDLCQVLSIGAVIEDTNNIKPLEFEPTVNIESTVLVLICLYYLG